MDVTIRSCTINFPFFLEIVVEWVMKSRPFWIKNLASWQMAVFRPFLAFFSPTTWISFTKLKFRQWFWGAERVQKLCLNFCFVEDIHVDGEKLARNSLKRTFRPVANFGDQSQWPVQACQSAMFWLSYKLA